MLNAFDPGAANVPPIAQGAAVANPATVSAPAALTHFTIIESLEPACVGKMYAGGANGKLVKTVVASLSKGRATTEAATTDNLAAALKQTTESSNKVIVLGSFNGATQGSPGVIEVVTEKKLESLTNGGTIGAVPGQGYFTVKEVILPVKTVSVKIVSARLKKLMTPSDWILIDADSPADMPDAWKQLTLAERLVLLEAILPGISTCLRIEYRGSSARVVNGSGAQNPGPTHALIQISDPSKLDLLREYVRLQAVIEGLSFDSKRHSKLNPGVVVGVERRTLIDLAVWVSGRLIFNARPVSRAPGYRVLDADVKIVNSNGGVLDIDWIKPPDTPALTAYRAKTKLDVSFGFDDGFRVHVHGLLKLNTEIEHHGEVRLMSDWLAWMRANKIDHLRCEAPFRDSDSEAAFIGIKGENDVIVHDIGVSTTYHMLPFTPLPEDDSQEAASAGPESTEDDESDDDALLARRAPKIDPRAFYGLLDKIVTETTRESEATKVGVAAQILAHVSLTLRPFHNPLGNLRIPFNLYVIQVGPSATGRKGTSAAIADAYLGPALQRLAGRVRARITFTDADEIARDEAQAEVEAAGRNLKRAKGVSGLHEIEIEIELDRLRADRAACAQEIAERTSHLRSKTFGPDTVRKHEKTIAAAQAKRDYIAGLVTASEVELAEVKAVLKDPAGALARAKADHDAAQAKLNGLPPSALPPEPWLALFAELAEAPAPIDGIGSGEGLIHAIRDPAQTLGPRGPVHDPGIADKRMFINMDEFGGVLAVIMRPGSTLSTTLRTLWDCRPAGAASKNSPVRCKEPYTTLSASITPGELIGRLFDKRDAASSVDNGFGNRPLYLWVQRDRLVAHPQPTPGLEAMMDDVAANIFRVYETLKPVGGFMSTPIAFSAAAHKRYGLEYKRIATLTAAGPNAAKLIKRLPVYLRKIAAILAVINGEHEISEGALEAAIAWIEYAAGTVSAIAATAADRRKTKALSDDGEAILAALRALGGDTKPVSSSEVRRKTRLDETRFDTAAGGLLQQAPSPIVISEEEWISGRGTRRRRAMITLNASVEDDEAPIVESKGPATEDSKAEGAASPGAHLAPEAGGLNRAAE
jgi:hypothetical protein